jgi:hypothetical protein
LARNHPELVIEIGAQIVEVGLQFRIHAPTIASPSAAAP